VPGIGEPLLSGAEAVGLRIVAASPLDAPGESTALLPLLPRSVRILGDPTDRTGQTGQEAAGTKLPSEGAQLCSSTGIRLALLGISVELG
jgi:hypothetical protein